MEKDEKKLSSAVLITGIPIVGIFIYAVGHLVSITYYRQLGIHTIDLLKTSCFEIGFSYLLCLFIITAFMFLPMVVYKLITSEEKPSYVTPYVSYIGLFLSIISVYLVMYAICDIALLLKPGEWSGIKYYFNRLLFGGVSGIIILVIINKNSGGIGRNLKVSSKFITLINDILRLILFVYVSYYFYLLFYHKLQNHLSIFLDEINSYFIYYTFLLIVLVSRLITNIKKKEAPERTILVSVLCVVVFIMNIHSYAVGPFVYIPTNNGGSYHYSIAEIALSKDINIDIIQNVYSVRNTPNPISNKLLFLVETNKFLYFAPYKSKMPPRELFSYLLDNKVFSIDKSLVQFIKYERMKF